jgi:hypothetical protein
LEEDEEEGEVSEGIRACRAGFLAETRKEEGEEEERKRRERRARGIVRCMLFGGGRCHRGRKEREGKGRKGKEREGKGRKGKRRVLVTRVDTDGRSSDRAEGGGRVGKEGG